MSRRDAVYEPVNAYGSGIINRVTSSAPSETDLRRELRRREQYRRCELLAEAIRHLARRTWYAVYKSQ